MKVPSRFSCLSRRYATIATTIANIMREIRVVVASAIVPGVFMVSLTLFICYQAVRRITRPLAELQKELEARTADN